jgi:hypothetical protein
MKWRRKMKKTDEKLNLVSVEVLTAIDVEGKVKIGKGGGGGQTCV